MVVSLGILPLRRRQDVNHDGYRARLSSDANYFSAVDRILDYTIYAETLIAAGVWFVLGLIL